MDWPKVFPLASSYRAEGLAADSAGNAYLAAQVAGPWNPGGGSITTTSNDTLVVSWTGLGGFRWATRLTSDGGKVSVNALKVSGNDLYAVGKFDGSNLRRDGALLSNRPAGATSAAFVVALNRNTGAARWSQALSGNGVFLDAAIDRAGNVLAAGEQNLSDRIGKMASFDSLGALRWVRPSTITAPFFRIGLDSADSSYLATYAPISPIDYGISSYSTSGALRWTRGPISSAVLTDVAVGHNWLAAVGLCLTGCFISGFVNPVEGAFFASFDSLDGHPRAVSTLPGATFQRAELNLAGSATLLGHFASGPVGVPPIGSTGAPGAFTAIGDEGAGVGTLRLVASAARGTTINARELAMSAGLPRFAALESTGSTTIEGRNYDTTAPWNGIVIRLP